MVLKVDYTTIFRWVQKYEPHLRKTGISYRVNETYIKVKGLWHYLYKAIDSYEDTIDFMFSPKRNAGAVFRFFRKMQGSCHRSRPKFISVDENSAYPPAFKALKKFHLIDSLTKIRQKKYLNNIVEQDHRCIKKLVRVGLWFKSLPSAWKTLQGYENMHMIRKGQVNKVPKKDIQKTVGIYEIRIRNYCVVLRNHARFYSFKKSLPPLTILLPERLIHIFIPMC